MAEETTTEETTTEETTTTEATPETVSKTQYDRAVTDLTNTKTEITKLTDQIAELQKASQTKEKTANPDKYVTSLEEENERLRNENTNQKTEFDNYKSNRDSEDVDRKKLGAFWETATQDGMQRDKDILNFVDKEAIQIDDKGNVNQKSIQNEINRIKKTKSYLFEAKAESINNEAPGEGEEKTKKSFADQGLAILGLS